MTRFLVALVMTTCITAQAALPTINVAASVTSGVAPLNVTFDLTGTTENGVSCFHTCDFQGNAGDANSAVTTNGAVQRPVNSKRGPVMHHLYKTPGTHKAVFQACNASGCATAHITINVFDPNSFYAGNATTCIGASSTPTPGSGGCPNGAATAQSSNLNAIVSSYGGLNKRILLQRGHTFTTSSGVTIAANGSYIDAFGTGSKPRVSSTSGKSGAAIYISSSGTPNFATARILNLEIDGNAAAGSVGMDWQGGAKRVVVMGVDFHRLQTAIIGSPSVLNHWNNNGRSGHTIWEEVTLAENTFTNPVGCRGYGIYLSGIRLALIDNNFDPGGCILHTVRIPFIRKGVISGNSLAGHGAGFHSMKMHGPNFGDAGVVGGKYSEEVVISNNQFFGSATSNANVVAQIAPENPTSDQRIRNIIVEDNWFRGRSSSAYYLFLQLSDSSIRRNLFDMTGGSGGGIGIAVQAQGIAPVSNEVRLFNNTFYNPGSGNFTAISIAGGASNIRPKNNLAWSDLSSSCTTVSGTGASGYDSATNSSNAQCNSADPQFVGPLTSPAGFRLSSGSYGRNAGTCVNLYGDFDQRMWPTATNQCDIGAMSTNPIRRGVGAF